MAREKTQVWRIRADYTVVLYQCEQEGTRWFAPGGAVLDINEANGDYFTRQQDALVTARDRSARIERELYREMRTAIANAERAALACAIYGQRVQVAQHAPHAPHANGRGAACDEMPT